MSDETAKERRYRADVTRYSEIDRQADPRAFVDYMDAMRGWPEMNRQKLATVAELRLKEGSVAIDVGCGTGEDAQEMAKHVGKTGHVIGLDASETMINEAKRRAQEAGNVEVEFIIGDICDLPFPDNHFDGVRAERVLEHQDDSFGALRELFRVTKPGGRLVALCPDPDGHLLYIPDRDLTRKLVHHFCDVRNSGWAGRELFSLFVKLGATDISATGFLHAHAGRRELEAPTRKRIDHALADGVISEEEAARAQELVTEQAEAGTLFFAAPMMMVAATKA